MPLRYDAPSPGRDRLAPTRQRGCGYIEFSRDRGLPAQALKDGEGRFKTVDGGNGHGFI
jgi:hypothetical protein